MQSFIGSQSPSGTAARREEFELHLPQELSRW